MAGSTALGLVGMDRSLKRGREEAVVDLDPLMLLQAQHKAMHERIAQYKLELSSMESEIASCKATKTALLDIVSLIGRQISAVSGGNYNVSLCALSAHSLQKKPPNIPTFFSFLD